LEQVRNETIEEERGEDWVCASGKIEEKRDRERSASKR